MNIQKSHNYNRNWWSELFKTELQEQVLRSILAPKRSNVLGKTAYNYFLVKKISFQDIYIKKTSHQITNLVKLMF